MARPEVLTAVKRLLALLAAVLFAAAAAVGVAWWQGRLSLPFGPTHHDLQVQLKDRGTVAVAGGVPLGLRRDETPLADYEQFPALAAALRGRDGAAAARAFREAHLDGLMVRTDKPVGEPGTLLRSLAEMKAARGLAAVYLDDTAALYETREPLEVSPADARRLIEVVRLILQGASPPPERLFPEVIRRASPTEVAVIVRDGHEPILWRAYRGGSIGRALIDATYAVLDRWSTRQQQRYGPLREAIQRLPLTIAVFYDRGTLGSRTPAFINRAVDPHVYAVGYEHLGRWEYVLPPTPWAPIAPPVQAIVDLAREHDVPPPGYLRPELTLYRFRAYQLIEQAPQGDVQIFDPN